MKTERELTGQLVELDGLRGLAILAVLLGHAWSRVYQTVQMAPDAALIAPFQLGWLGVDCFFVLSGFLITGILLDTRDSPQFFRGFYMRRALRIFPLYYAALIAYFWVKPLLLPGDKDLAWLVPRQGWYWLCMQNWLVVREGEWIRGSGVIGHFWSLAIEEQFYLVWPMLVYVGGRRGLIWIASALILAAFGLRCFLVMNDCPYPSIYVMTPARIDALAAGGLMAALIRRDGGLPSVSRSGVPGLAIGLAGLFAASIAAGGIGHRSPWMQTLGYSAVAVLFSFLILLILKSPSEGWSGRALRSRFLVFLGKHSYAIYVFHWVAMHSIQWFLPQRTFAAIPSAALTFAVFFTAATLISIGAALVSWRYLEEPFMKLKSRFPR